MTQPENIFDDIAQLLPAESREHFYRKMGRLRDLNPDDDMLQIAEAMGFLALLIRQTPAELAAERAEFGRLCQQTVTAIELAQDRMAAYQHGLDQRLQNLPAKIVAALNPEDVAAVLTETLRQRLAETGLPAISAELSRHAQALHKTSHQFSSISEALGAPERGALAQISRALTIMQSHHDSAACHVRALSNGLVKDLHRALAVLCIGSMLIGFFLGVHYAQWTSHN